MDIYLTEVANSGSSLRFPALPKSINYGGAARYQTYDIISLGTVKVPSGTDVINISWTATFFGESRKRESYIRAWKAPKECQNILQRWRDNGTVLRLLVTNTSLNYDVTIENLDCIEKGAHGDIEYSISFVKKKEIRVYTTDELKIAAYVKKSRPADSKTNGNYTVVTGDNLWSIAQRFLGGGTRWTEVYNLNKDIIEASAKRYGKPSSDNGHWIYPGDVYTLPAA